TAPASPAPHSKASQGPTPTPNAMSNEPSTSTGTSQVQSGIFVLISEHEYRVALSPLERSFATCTAIQVSLYPTSQPEAGMESRASGRAPRTTDVARRRSSQ